MIESAFVPVVAPDRMPTPARRPAHHPEAEAAIFARADELNARNAEILKWYS
ncbi:hypothetical protein ACH4Y0_34560 [Streptomyces sp. NPDC020707]|uniref:hypothetical protein n=1 Tax=Streptomyces sp. NPDC020707 TaxID=3365084 RepID=UPI0037B15A49